MTDASLIEIMARAICRCDGYDPDIVPAHNSTFGPCTGQPVDACARPKWTTYRDVAKSELAALRAAGYAVVEARRTIEAAERAVCNLEPPLAVGETGRVVTAIRTMIATAESEQEEIGP